jgi:hypothetical protein
MRQLSEPARPGARARRNLLHHPGRAGQRFRWAPLGQGHLLTLTTAQVLALAAHLPRGRRGRPGIHPVGAAFQRTLDQRERSRLPLPRRALPVARHHPPGAAFLRGAGLRWPVLRARRWLGRYGGAVAVSLFRFSGAALFFAWRDSMPTFTGASLIAAGTGALLWAVLAAEATARRRAWAGLAGFAALEAAVSVRYTDIVVLGCAVAAVTVAWRLPSARLPTAALAWWLGSVAVFGAGVAVFNYVIYGGPLKSGYQPGEVTFSLSALLPNLRYMPAHLIEAMPLLVPGLAGLGWIAWRWVRLRKAGSEIAAGARRTWPWALPLPRPGSACGGCMPPTPGRPTRA